MCHETCQLGRLWKPEAQTTRFCQKCRLWQHVKCLQLLNFDDIEETEAQRYFWALKNCSAESIPLEGWQLEAFRALQWPVERSVQSRAKPKGKHGASRGEEVPWSYEVIVCELRHRYCGATLDENWKSTVVGILGDSDQYRSPAELLCHINCMLEPDLSHVYYRCHGCSWVI